MSTDMRCRGGAEVGVDWANGLVIHEGDADWHRWDTKVYGESPKEES